MKRVTDEKSFVGCDFLADVAVISLFEILVEILLLTDAQNMEFADDRPRGKSG